MVNVLPVTQGRGTWPNDGDGGTLVLDGTKLGPWYRSPAGTMKWPGYAGYVAAKNNTSVDLNFYAVYRAVKDLQRVVGATSDGLFGAQTGDKVKTWQANHGLVADGVVGPKTTRAMYHPVVLASAKTVDTSLTNLGPIAGGHIGWESGWDPGAVGVTTPDDVGLGQINGPSHPDMSLDDRLDPRKAITWIVNFVDDNITQMNGVEDDGIAAYNLGVGGARSWVKAGRPQFFNGVDVWKYIANVRNAM